MKISFLNPPRFQRRLTEDLTVSFNVSRFSRGVDLVYGVTPPTELATLAGQVARGHDVSILDANALSLLPREVNRWILNESPDYLVIKCGDATLLDDLMYYYFAESVGVKTVVWEDMLNPLFSEELRELYGVKRILYGEPERVIGDFLSGKQGALGGDIVPDLNALAPPLMSALPMSSYRKEGRRTWYSFLARGCGWAKCEFCLMAAGGIPLRLRGIEHIRRELDLLQGHAVDSIYFWDPQFNPSIERAVAVCELLRRYGFRWECWLRCTPVDEALVRTMKKSGCFRIHIGMESGSQTVHDSMNKGIRVADIELTIRLAHKHGIETAAYLVLGTPEESRETFKETRALIRRARPTTIVPASFRPFPNVPLTKRMQQEGLIEQDHFSLAEGANCFGFTTVSKTKFLDRAALAAEIGKVHRLATRLAFQSYLAKPSSWRHLLKPFLLRTASNFMKNRTSEFRC